MNNSITGIKIQVKGIVQGVGFRPFIYGNAIQNNLTGWVRNTSSGVDIELNGSQENIETFLEEIRTNPPPLAQIDSIELQSCPPNHYSHFEIITSKTVLGDFIPLSPDVVICPDCSRELLDQKDHRFHYPFINCTNCGPRFSIITNIPYDRPYTTMAEFMMCPRCNDEYQNPSDRRFHAQPIACPDCGPQVRFLDNKGSIIHEREKAIQEARSWIKEGKIIAIKGLGGYHLACDATNPDSLISLRSRKLRTDKPFALMAFNMEEIKRHCMVTMEEEALLKSPAGPIVVMPRSSAKIIPDVVSPNQQTLGFMLPTTPLHMLLMEPEAGYPKTLVMTSGNLSEEPIAYRDDEASFKLGNVADAFLVHNRPIHMRLDDSVTRVFDSKPYFIRRSRGYAPDPIRLHREIPPILAAGAELKNTFCLSKNNYAFISHHIGDLENFETYKSYVEAITHYEQIFRTKPEQIVCDMHPDYLATQYAHERASQENIPVIEVQHHHAHLASCLADNLYNDPDPVIGIIYDGTGYGTDHTIWGGEVLIGDYSGFSRPYHLKYVRMPGGDLAVKNPIRMALSHLWQAGIDWNDANFLLESISTMERSVIHTQLEKGVNSPFTSSMGRFFDAVSALLGVCLKTNYEGQAAIELEAICDPDEKGYYNFDFDNNEINPTPVWNAIIEDIHKKLSAAIISAKFHNSLAVLNGMVCESIKSSTGIKRAVLSGGVWQNMILLKKTSEHLNQNGFDVMIHRRVPSNDGGIALGQLMIAALSMNK